MLMHKWLRGNVLLLSYFIFSVTLLAQGEQVVRPSQASPYNTIYTHLYFLQSDSYNPIAAASSFNLADTVQAKEMAMELKYILDGNGYFVDMESLPTDSNYVDSLSGKQVFYPFPVEFPEYYVEKEEGKWYVSDFTVSQIPGLYSKLYPLGADYLIKRLPLGHSYFLGLETWQWVGLGAIIIVTILLYYLLVILIVPAISNFLANRIAKNPGTNKLVHQIASRLSFFVMTYVVKLFLPQLLLPIAWSKPMTKVIDVFSIFILASLFFKVVSLLEAIFKYVTSRTPGKMDDQLVPLVRRFLNLVIVALAIVEGLRLFGVNVTTLLAGLSIGGIALALAAQDTLKNLFGSVMVFLDKPFQVGDWVNFDGVDGTVEEVGFRSTRVRTFANSQVYVPNGKLADSVIDNYGLREYRRFKTTIAITYDTPPALIDEYVKGLEALVRNHPKTRKDYYEIHLNGMGASSLDILFYIFFEVDSWTDELKARHEILIQVIELAHVMGVRFAFPTSTMFVEELPGQPSLTPKYDESASDFEAKRKAYIQSLQTKTGYKESQQIKDKLDRGDSN